MTQSLLTLFTEAFMAEQKRYAVLDGISVLEPFSNQCFVCEKDKVETGLFTGTRADCERFVVTASARKGFGALRDSLLPTRSSDLDAVEAFLRNLATEPETTSGEANAS